ncbi:hypothetical protein KRR40_46135 [Niabella defluvii]|nr:hypothetical protein KRR40_46135 [Niabella sp. I65]
MKHFFACTWFNWPDSLPVKTPARDNLTGATFHLMNPSPSLMFSPTIPSTLFSVFPNDPGSAL